MFKQYILLTVLFMLLSFTLVSGCVKEKISIKKDIIVDVLERVPEKNENVKSFPKKPAKLLDFRGLKLKIFFSSKRKKVSQTRVLGFPIVGFLYRSLSSDPGPRQ